MNIPRGVRAFALVAGLTAVTACERGYAGDPAAIGSVPLALELVAAAATGGPADAFDRADSLLVRVRSGDRVRFERIFAISAAGSDLRMGLEVPATGANEAAVLQVELRLGRAALFRGEAPVSLRLGREARLSVALAPVIAGLVLPDSVPALASYGDVVDVDAAAVFATGDTAEVATVEWTSLEPAVVGIENGRPVARSDGLARVVAHLEELADTMRVRVFAVVRSVVVSPNPTTLGLGESRALSALLLDARGNVITGRAVSWLSSDTTIIRVAPDGTATGRGVGIARITAQSGAASSSALVEAVAGAPTATTRQPDQITTTAARLHGSVAPGGVSTQVWFEFGREPTFTTRSTTAPQSANGGQPVDVSAQLSSLLPNTRYFFRVIARNGVGTSVGEALTFTTTAGVPGVITDPASGISRTGATLHGRVVSNGAGTAWFEIGTSSNPATFSKRATIALGAGTVQIRIDDAVTGLQPGTTYWFRMAARTSEGERTGEVRSFTTLPPEPEQVAPTVITQAAGPVRMDSAVANALVNPNGAATEAWFEYDTDPQLSEFSSTARQPVGAGTANVAFQQLIQGLSPATTYYVRAAASNGAGTARGAIVQFTTGAPPAVPPTVTTIGSGQIGQTTATLTGSANARGSATDVWFEYGTDPSLSEPATSPAQSIGDATAVVPFAEGLTGLAPATTYFFRAVARNEAGTVRGSILQFTTLAPPPEPPTVITGGAAVQGDDAAEITGTVNPNGSATQVWFEYGTHPQLVEPSSTPEQAAGGGNLAQPFNALLDDLDAATTYYYRAVGANVAGTTRGTIASFTTEAPPPDAPDVTTDSANTVTTSGARLFGTVVPNGAATEVWFEYATNDALEGSDETAPQAMGAGRTAASFSAALGELQSATRYFYRAIASNAEGTDVGEILSFTTEAPPVQSPTVTTQAAEPVRADSAVANALVNPNGAATDAWFEYGTAPDLATFTSTPQQDVGVGSTALLVQELIQGLQPGTTYYVRAAASNSGGTTKGAIVSFTTQFPPSPPTVSTQPASGIGEKGATLNGTVNPEGHPTSVWFEVADNNDFEDPVSTPARDAGSGATESPFAEALTDLIPGETYYYRALAKNDFGTVQGQWLPFTTTTPEPGPPTARTDSARYTDPFGSEIMMWGTVNPNGNVTEAWFEHGLFDVNGVFVPRGASPPQQLGDGFADLQISIFLNEEGQWIGAAAASAMQAPVRVRVVARNANGEIAYGTPFAPLPRQDQADAEVGIGTGVRPATPVRRLAPRPPTRSGGAGGSIDGGNR
jgi:phosphodiesterase/alkaline phosphatase D-like protein